MSNATKSDWQQPPRDYHFYTACIYIQQSPSCIRQEGVPKASTQVFYSDNLRCCVIQLSKSIRNI